jgi:DNA-binding NarL/FixJ family response regulator
MIRVIVADDHPIIRQGLERLLATAGDLELVGMAADGAEAVDLARERKPDIVLMDLSMAGMDGVEATRRIVASDDQVRIVVLTSFGDDQRISDALNAGAHGYLLKDVDPEDLLEAIRSAHGGDVPLDPRAGRVLLEQRGRQGRAEKLTSREEEVLRLVGQGLVNKQIARRLGIGERTVKAHLTNVFRCLGVSDRVQAALWAREHLPAQSRHE